MRSTMNPLPFKHSLPGALLTAAFFLMPAISASATARVAAQMRTQSTIHHRMATIDGVRVFYREAGPTNAPAIVLLHGFPTSSNMFRNLIPALAHRYHVIAPDYPGFGH